MDINEFEVEFQSELEQGLDHAEWYQDQIKWMIRRIKQLEQRNKRISDTALEQIGITQERNERLEKKAKQYEDVLNEIIKTSDYNGFKLKEIAKKAIDS